MVVCPGGGYGHLAIDHEGEQIARWLNSFGVAAFMLKYRIAPRYHHPAPLQDAQQAIRMVRSRAQEWLIRPDRVGIWGFSAGGHLASTAGTHFDAGTRPDFMILAYAVISFTTPYAHKGSRNNLIGENPDPKLVESLSNELQVTAQTPPTFLFHTTTDQTVPVENSVLFLHGAAQGGRARRRCTSMPTARTAWDWRPRTWRSRRGRAGWRNGCRDAVCSAALRSKRLAALSACARAGALQLCRRRWCRASYASARPSSPFCTVVKENWLPSILPS